jgi:hypothetical protein
MGMQHDQHLNQLEMEVLLPPGAVKQLEDHVENLKLSHGAMAIKMGGVVFPDEAATEAWVRHLAEENAHCFAVDMFSFFLMADPKYETISQGLQQTATAVKVQFASIDLPPLICHTECVILRAC